EPGVARIRGQRSSVLRRDGNRSPTSWGTVAPSLGAALPPAGMEVDALELPDVARWGHAPRIDRRKHERERDRALRGGNGLKDRRRKCANRIHHPIRLQS